MGEWSKGVAPASQGAQCFSASFLRRYTARMACRSRLPSVRQGLVAGCSGRAAAVDTRLGDMFRIPHASLTISLFLAAASPSFAQVESIELPAELAIPEGVDLGKSFTLRVCVRMNAAPEDLPLLVANKAWESGEVKDYTTNNSFGLGRESGALAGFAISVLPDGAWTWNAGDGRRRIDHRPEAADQGIADGRWHEVGFTIDREQGVACLYHDGRRVALHDLSGVGSLSGAPVLLGAGAPELEIGALRVEAGVARRDTVAADFAKRFGEERRPPALPVWDGRPLRVLAWNIWHGGRRKGRDEGVQRVVEVIKESGADIVLMQETYGSGPRISGRLGFDYFLRSSNLSVMSRFPIKDVHRLGPSFRFGGVTLELAPDVEMQAYSLWINHLPSVSKQLDAGATGEELAAADYETRGKEMDSILAELLPHLAQTPDMPVLVGGDFNSGSHLDWTKTAKDLPDHHGRAVPWPVSLSMERAGFVDTYRAAHPSPVDASGRTWSPEFKDSHQDRIDYVYARGDAWRVVSSKVLDEHPRGWPSDHAAVLSTLELKVTRAPAAHIEFDGDGTMFTEGLQGKALRLRKPPKERTLTVDSGGVAFTPDKDFSVQFWMRTNAADDARMLVLSNKEFPDNSFASQKNAGWAFLASQGTWAWNLGSGKRRVAYERDNGERMPLGDGRWHQLAMTYDSARGVATLYYDGKRRAAYNVKDSTGFDFSSERSVIVGGGEHGPEILPAIEEGTANVQALVDAFHALDLGEVAPDELVELVVEPQRYYERKLTASGEGQDPNGVDPLAAIKRAESALMKSPYTIHQAFSFMEVAPLMKLYSLEGGQVVLDEAAARKYSMREHLHASDFDIDELTFWDRALSAYEIADSYDDHFNRSELYVMELQVTDLTIGVWNIFHGGLHFSVDEHGFDARVAIAEIIEREGIDVVLMQETYSAGDFIAAELGYDFATTVDWDYLNQGSNISVLSRYPILEVRVPEGAAFMNVAARIQISETQDAWVMSNWYGMDSFPEVAEFHATRFAASDTTPVFFGGDFNAVPPSDGGKSLAATTLLDLGFTDAFRSLYPDASAHPGHSHRSGSRIDQLFYKGAGARNTSTRVLSEWPPGFPSDHYLIRAGFKLPVAR